MGAGLGRSALAVAVLCLAGCASPDSGEPAAGPVASPPGAAAWAWTDCRGAIVQLHGPSALYPDGTPPGWQASSGMTGVRVTVLECQRIAWGPFERGPVFVLQEWRDDARPPPRCTDGLDVSWPLLTALWFSDPDLAAYARETHGLPALAVESASPPAASAGRQEWTWALPGQEPSSLLVMEAPGFSDLSPQADRRLFWPRGDGLGALDLRSTSAVDQLDPQVATGTLRAPLLHGAAHPAPEFASVRAAPVAGWEAEGRLSQFEDTACERPS